MMIPDARDDRELAEYLQRMVEEADERAEAHARARAANRTAARHRLDAHRRDQARALHWEHAAIAILLALAFLNAAWQMGWLARLGL